MPSKVDNMDDLSVSSKVLEKCFSVGDRQIRNLAKEGTVVKISHGKYDLIRSVKNYITLLKTNKAVEEVDKEDKIDFEDEKAKHERVKREVAELKYKEMLGDLHRSEDVERVMNDQYAAFRARLMNIPAKIASQVTIINDKSQAEALIMNEIREALFELSEYDPTVFYSDAVIEIDEVGEEDGASETN